jgi:hypothetical protein
MTGPGSSTFCEELKGGASIGDTLLLQFINLAKATLNRHQQKHHDRERIGRRP